MALQGEHLQIAHGLEDAQGTGKGGGRGLHEFPRPGVDRKNHGEKTGSAGQEVQGGPQAGGIVGRFRPMQGGEKIGARHHAEVPEQAGPVLRPRQREGHGLPHHVGHFVHTGPGSGRWAAVSPDPLASKVFHSGPTGAEEDAGEVVRRDTVDLLRHPAVETAQARLHVDHGDVQFGGGQGAREG